MSLPEMRRPCLACNGTQVLRTIEDGFTIWQDCRRCEDGCEPEPSEKEREDAGQLTLGGDV
jgi:hypothetical protein